ncbi:Helix-turn-helix XRE-family like protein [Ralstonia phage phiRSL1]|uniref:Helix-turn-helix XRE-family like protein n=1 Tax=Ralstonia phage phiRSL1 TaxID=1980924 RepID=B2ZXN6_9CAUD|nr:Helix-turn-helix XRE-family like protein [Ralstonia phage phiRSL1]BAG41461.1 Helix-turn-helix XRE-family like protein [Ralstonia phage phiRSL1]
MTTTNINEKFSALFRAEVKRVRKARRLKQEDVARMGGLSREAYLRFENGTSDMRISSLDAVLKGLGVEMEFYLLATGEAPAPTTSVAIGNMAQSLSNEPPHAGPGSGERSTGLSDAD